MSINIIVAMDNNGTIGKEGDMPWKLVKDLRHFKETTEGHVVVMGSSTYKSIGKDLPNRANFVLTSRPHTMRHSYPDSNAVFGGLFDLLNEYHNQWSGKEIFIIGGANVYKQFLPSVDRMYITRINAEIDGDTHFPYVDFSDWKLDECCVERVVDNGFELAFMTYERV